MKALKNQYEKKKQLFGSPSTTVARKDGTLPKKKISFPDHQRTNTQRAARCTLWPHLRPHLVRHRLGMMRTTVERVWRALQFCPTHFLSFTSSACVCVCVYTMFSFLFSLATRSGDDVAITIPPALLQSTSKHHVCQLLTFGCAVMQRQVETRASALIDVQVSKSIR